MCCGQNHTGELGRKKWDTEPGPGQRRAAQERETRRVEHRCAEEGRPGLPHSPGAVSPGDWGPLKDRGHVLLLLATSGRSMVPST